VTLSANERPELHLLGLVFNLYDATCRTEIEAGRAMGALGWRTPRLLRRRHGASSAWCGCQRSNPIPKWHNRVDRGSLTSDAETPANLQLTLRNQRRKNTQAATSAAVLREPRLGRPCMKHRPRAVGLENPEKDVR
jgi:hypothetical protein